MKAMLLMQIHNLAHSHTPLELAEVPNPIPAEDEILLKVSACGVCHTELDEIEGRAAPPNYPIIPGHQVVGVVVAAGSQVTQFQIGQRAGVAWIFSSCQRCEYCLAGADNLCAEFKATGRDANGGYAEYMIVAEPFAYPIPDVFTDAEAAPLLCAGAIGYRSLRLCGLGDGQTLGLTGFGASAHIVLQLARWQYPHSKIFVFSRSAPEQDFARQLGADWAGYIDDIPPETLNCAIDTTPAWKPVVETLRNLAPGGRLVINAIRKEAFDQEYLLQLDYPTHLWMEKEIKSVANISRQDTIEFLQIAAQIPIRPETQLYSLEQANSALLELKNRQIRGAKVLVIE